MDLEMEGKKSEGRVKGGRRKEAQQLYKSKGREREGQGIGEKGSRKREWGV